MNGDEAIAFAIDSRPRLGYALPINQMGKAMAEINTSRWGALAAQTGKRLPVQVCQSRAGFYVGTLDEEGLPYSRESAEYWGDKIKAEQALNGGKWTQRGQP